MNLSVLPVDLDQVDIASDVREIINEFLEHHPITFVDKQLIESLADKLSGSFWIKNSDGNFIVVNKRFCDQLALKKFQVEGKSYKEFLPHHLIKFFESIEIFQKDIKAPLTFRGIPVYNLQAQETTEIIEIPLLDIEKNIIALVGFSRNLPTTLPIQGTDLITKEFNELLSLVPLPFIITDNSGLTKLCNMEFCKLLKKNFEFILNSRIENLLPQKLFMAINDFVKTDSSGIIIELDENLDIISKPVSGFKLTITRYYSDIFQEELIALVFKKSAHILQNQNNLLRKEEMSEILIQNNPQPIFIYDKENLRFLGVNDAALRLYGYTEDEFLQMDLTDLYTPEDIQTLLESSEEKVKEGEFSKPFKHRKKDGSFVFVRISKIGYRIDDTDAFLNILDNVTERLELEKYNQLFKSAFENTSDLIFVTDPEGIITFVNDSASKVLGVPRLELVNTSILSYCDDEDRVFLNSSVFHSHIKETVTFTIKLKSSDGRVIETDTTSTPVFDSENEVESFSFIARIPQTTTQAPVQTKEVIKEVVKEVVVEKPVIKEIKSSELGSSFLSGVFHEILTPMNVILGFAQELTESIENLSPEQKEAVDIINQNRSSLLGLMNTIIEFSEIQSKLDKSEISKISITDVIEHLDKNIKEITGSKEVELAYGKISSSLKFSTDRKKFESFLNNLTRLVSRITNQKKIYFSAYPVENDSFNISVSDGFARSSTVLLDTLKKLFIEKKEPKEVGVSKLNFQIISSLLNALDGQFITINEFTDKHDFAFKFPLSLSPKTEISAIEEFEMPEVTPEKIEMKEPEPFNLKEEIEIEVDESKADKVEKQKSEPVTEKIEMPEQLQIQEEGIAEQPVHEEEITIEETPASPSAKKNGISSLRCLYIEDQIDSQILFKVQMKELKNIQFAASFEEALPLLETQKFDFIVMDINLQGEYNGLDALKIIHQMSGFENVPVIAVTAYVLPGDKEKFIATGFTDFISKPIFREKMLESLKKIFVN